MLCESVMDAWMVSSSSSVIGVGEVIGYEGEGV